MTNIVMVRGQTTLETLNVSISLGKKRYSEFAGIPVLEDEKTYYTEIQNAVEDKFSLMNESTSRQYIIQNDECISTLHFLLAREKNRLFVYMRSSDTARIASDLGFLSRLANKYSIDELLITIGSLHTILI
jgi:hypothetical protein